MESLDEKDLKIIEILQEHGDYATRDIATEAHLPITTVHNRIQRLKAQGIIRKFTIDVHPEVLNKGFMAYVLISVNIEHLKQVHKTQHDIAQELSTFDFIERADVIAGGTDIIAVIQVKDVKEFNQVLLTKVQQIAGIKETKSMIVV